MVKPKFITFTGFDDRTCIDQMVDISKAYPVEWGVLVSPHNRDARFPSNQAIKELVDRYWNLNLSMHCCGQYSRNVQSLGEFPYQEFILAFKRFQLNGKIIVSKSDIVSMYKKIGASFIFQGSNFDRSLSNQNSDAISVLFDTSGGRGIVPDKFPMHPGFFCGYAGGISPENVIEVIEKINAPEGAEYWIDMETGVRTNGWFDMQKVMLVCDRVFRF